MKDDTMVNEKYSRGYEDAIRDCAFWKDETLHAGNCDRTVEQFLTIMRSQNDNHTIKFAKLIELREKKGKYLIYDGTYFRYSDKWKTYERISINRIKKAKDIAETFNANDVVYICFQDIPMYEIDETNQHKGRSTKTRIHLGNNILSSCMSVECGKLKERLINRRKYSYVMIEYYIDEKYYHHYIK